MNRTLRFDSNQMKQKSKIVLNDLQASCLGIEKGNLFFSRRLAKMHKVTLLKLLY